MFFSFCRIYSRKLSKIIPSYDNINSITYVFSFLLSVAQGIGIHFYLLVYFIKGCIFCGIRVYVKVVFYKSIIIGGYIPFVVLGCTK